MAATRYPEQYDGYLAGAPGFHLPKAATAQMWKVQQYAGIATGTIATGADAGQPDITTAVSPAEFNVLGASIVAKCDALDGATDGMVSDVKACQAAFNIKTDVTTCGGARDGTCLTDAQKNVLAKVFAGATNSKGEATYSNFWYDPGVAGVNYAYWHYTASTQLDPGAVAFIFNTPPMAKSAFLATTGLKFALGYNMDTDHPKMFATDATYQESAWSYMTPPNETSLGKLRDRGARLLVYHGGGDGIFSTADTAKWYESLPQGISGGTDQYARLFVVPGMNHCSAGPATDQFDMITSLVNWVEKDRHPSKSRPRRAAPAPTSSIPNCRRRGARPARARCARTRRSRATTAAATSKAQRASAASRSSEQQQQSRKPGQEPGFRVFCMGPPPAASVSGDLGRGIGAMPARRDPPWSCRPSLRYDVTMTAARVAAQVDASPAGHSIDHEDLR